MLTVGVDIGGTSVRAGVVDSGGAVLDQRRAPTASGEAALEDAVTGVVAELAGEHRVAAVGLAVAGFVTADRLRVRFAPHLPWRDAPIVTRLADRLALPVLLDNDANAAMVAEHRFGAAGGARVVMLVALGTGIGAALLIDGQLFRGGYGVAPELGHLRVVPDGRSCACGKRGCWERYCSGTALAVTAVELLARRRLATGPLAREAAGDPGGLNGARVAAAAREGDPLAGQAMSELARWLGQGLALIADVYDPELVVVGGGLAGSAPLFLDEAREQYASVLTGAGHRPLAQIRTGALGDGAALIGAAQLARDSL